MTKKVYTSLLLILLAIGFVASSAYALLSDSVTLTNVTFSTSDGAFLTISVDGTNFDTEALTNSVVFQFTELVPGFDSEAAGGPYDLFYLKNESDFPLEIDGVLQGFLEEPDGSWEALRDNVEVKIASDSTPALQTDWYTLLEWSNGGSLSNGFDIPVDSTSGDLEPDTVKAYRMYVRVPIDADIGMMDTELINTTFRFNGVQAPTP